MAPSAFVSAGRRRASPILHTLVGLAVLALNLPCITALPFYTNSTVPANLSPECQAALMADVADCYPVVGALRNGAFYPQAVLETMCTSACTAALAAYRGSIATACSGQTWVGYEDVGWPVTVIPELMIYHYNLACLMDEGRYCNVVAADYAAQLDPQAGHPIYGTSWPGANTTAPIDTCDLCFIKSMRIQAGSPYYNGPRLLSQSQYQSKTSSCSVTGYPLTTTDPPAISEVPATTTTDGSTETPGACAGTTYQIQPGDTCHSVSTSQGIGTAWLLMDNDLAAACADFPTSGSLCLVNTCSVYTVAQNDTCDSISSAHNITLAQFKSWNPSINSGCYNLDKMVGYQVCVSIPGRPYVAPTTTIAAPTIPTTPAPVPTDLANQTTTYCGRYYQAQVGDYCNLIVMKYGISLSDFVFLNPAINVNCTNLFAQESYCVQAVGDINTYSGHPNSQAASATLTSVILTEDLATTLPDATWTAPPALWTDLPMAPQTRPDCETLFDGIVFAAAPNWNSPCELAASSFGVTLEELGVWNPSLGNTSLPSCGFNTSYQYCGKYWFGSAPQVELTFELPMRNGTLKTGCYRYVDLTDNLDCLDVLEGYNITIAQFYAWNTDVGPDCTGLQPGYQYCVELDEGVTLTTTTTTAPTTTTGTGTSTTAQPTGPPGPVQEGQPENCNKWHLVVAGDNCNVLENTYFLTHAQFLLWNPSVSSDCVSGFWPDYYYCVGTTDTVSSTRVSSPTAPTATATPVPAPDPHQDNNAISSCNKYAQAQTGDGCWAFADRNGVALEQLYAWNAVLGADGSGVPGVEIAARAQGAGGAGIHNGLLGPLHRCRARAGGGEGGAGGGDFNGVLAKVSKEVKREREREEEGAKNSFFFKRLETRDDGDDDDPHPLPFPSTIL
ncbi:hypothetical protein BDZ91DRAFT_785929 [Kalaharituber pfeilii]|nr:hypothetical protein BDZ91DRAFT_785929 [Kalaharituber pfeilii]